MSARVRVVLDAATAYAHAAAGDVVIPPAEDLAQLFHARPDHPPGPHLRRVVLGAVAGAQQRAAHLAENITVWLVHPDPTPEQLRGYAARGWDVAACGDNSGGPPSPRRAAANVEAATQRYTDRTSMPAAADTGDS